MPPEQAIPQGAVEVPPLGFVKLVDWVGDELAIANAARVSFHKEARLEQSYGGLSLSQADKGLIRFLLREKHGSPFEFGFVSQWHIRLPIFVMREWVRHRIASVNEESGRYVKMRPDFFTPDHLRVQEGKPGAYTFRRLDDDHMLNEFLDDLDYVYNECWTFYQTWLDKGIAKEQARIALPLSLYTEIRWQVNARSLMNFVALRNAPTAMTEIRSYAEAIETIFSQTMPTVHQAFVENDRIAP